MSSNRPELVALRECLEAHPDNENLLYLTDSESTLQAINLKWIGGGTKLSLVKTTDADVLRVIIVKLQQRVKARAVTLLIKVKTHRGCPLNEEEDIRAEMGRMKEEPNKQHGPRRFGTEQGRSKLTVLTRRKWKSGERSTCREKGKKISQ